MNLTRYFLVWRGERFRLSTYEGGRMHRALILGWWEPPSLLGDPVTLEVEDDF